MPTVACSPGSLHRLVAATVKTRLSGGHELTASTREAVAELGLAEGSPVVALVKSAEISLATG
ncbi:TOBE domain-containing protein [Amycolatopsis vancoresmycina]|uniref:Molybdenum binding protein n=1 Tax=Amycolatopsis vancoresmycina DSM 44592 TaxID=1292037 RepID=R1HX74_9PSEU|nr:TOBE domain-containing protein [Amycolatopsis vancoresmycina]EOD64921.1 molybdenum binding protein [Amycolatopsis vancoresmycina DSM 44592]